MDKELLDWNPLGEEPDGWKYKDFNKMPTEQWHEFLEILGEDNYRLITEAEYQHDGKLYKRGQMFISLAGIERAKEYVKNRTN